MTAASLIIGLDGADLDVIQTIGEAKLPTLHRLMAKGAFARLRCVNPPATLPNWTSFLTGADPGVHGVFDFTMRDGYRVRFTGGSARAVPTAFAHLDRLGLQCACMSFPGTWPVEQLKHGVYISGWDAPVAFEADASYVWPRQLHSSIVQRFGPLRFDTADEFQADQAGWHQRLPAILLARIKQKTDLASWLLDQKPWDVFAVYFGESDTAAHHLWSLHDPHSPRRPQHSEIGECQGLSQVYQALDQAVSELEHRAGAGQQLEITIVSDHGSGGSSDKVFYLNRWLAEGGWLTFKPRARAGAAATWAKQAALHFLTPKIRQQLFESARRRLPSWLESQARFGNIDMQNTRVFSDELNYFPALHFNLTDREPEGQLRAQEIPRLQHELEAALLAIRDPWTGHPVIKAVHRREGLFMGPLVNRAPDLLLEFHLDNGYSYNLLPSGDVSATAAWRLLDSDEHLGRKGRSLPGSHRDRGIFIAAGPHVSATGLQGVHMTEAMGHALRRLDRSVINNGINLPEMSSFQPSTASKRGQAQIAARLRSLGYIE